MITKKTLFRLSFIFFILGSFSGDVYGQSWEQIKDKHFVVHYAPTMQESEARKVLRRAEQYYNSIGNRIGYARYSQFWTWDERVKIFIFPDQNSFSQTTGQPPWSLGYSQRDSYLFKSRTIVTYEQEGELFTGVLPHEIGHLIIQDFLGPNSTQRVPLWFHEGVAQIEEANKKVLADKVMRAMVKRDAYIKFNVLMRLDIRKEQDARTVQIFYAQSVSIVDFLIKKYGSRSFGQLCRNLKEGKTFEAALHSAYTNIIDSVSDLEDKWVKYLKR